MDDIYDIFERRPEGAMWVESFVGLHGIDGRLTHLHSQRSGKYFVYSVHDAKVIAEFPRDTNTGSPAAEAAPLHQVTPSLDELSGTNGNGANGSGANGNGANGNGANGNGAAAQRGKHQAVYQNRREADSKTAESSDFLPPE